MRQLFSDYSAIIKGFLILFTIINYIKISFIIVLKISSYWVFHSVSAIIKHFITILTVNVKCIQLSWKKRPVGKKTPSEGGLFTDGTFCLRNDRRVFLPTPLYMETPYKTPMKFLPFFNNI